MRKARAKCLPRFLSSGAGAPGTGQGSPAASTDPTLQSLKHVSQGSIRSTKTISVPSASRTLFLALGLSPWERIQGPALITDATRHTGRAETIPGGRNSSCEHSRLERSTQAGGPGRRTGQLGGRDRGGSRSSRQGQAVWGLENRIRNFRFHPKTKGQFSKDLS